ncbi:pre-mRNA-splicing factor CWC25-like protein [Cucumis melo var. makuwa]|uniref:Pre-mRNA-splicing factor CWC25-like protein n=1 Tax=Cucumis melo var. makuwa TaxID=1194695 RepID=A0A5D3CF18_CUCMM|nr:pre-mRNA-splicing factor CWC25-like protein [Cucumis melo var. makuwa]TYK09818.1 pre-mRNA-splicing factor CWC25-like protein [Cucumis melo var. makuwa]
MGEPICMTLVVAAGNKILQKKGTVIFFFTFFRKHETLNLLYELGLEVGKASNSDGFKSLETLPSSTIAATATEPSSSKALLQALFEDEPHSANDAWRKLHSDPLLII